MEKWGAASIPAGSGTISRRAADEPPSDILDIAANYVLLIKEPFNLPRRGRER